MRQSLYIKITGTLIFLAVLLLLLGLAYPFYLAKQAKNALELQAITTPFHQQIEAKLLTPAQHNAHAWNGAGQRFFNKTWRHTAHQTDRLSLFRLYLSQYADDDINSHYVNFPHQFVLQYGHHPDAILLIWNRQNGWSWQLAYVCSVKPHPSALLNTCPSESR